MHMLAQDIVVVGASAGGVEALITLAKTLPAELPAAVLMVLHVPQTGSMLPTLLSRAGPLPARHPADREPLKAGQIYVAPPDQHMLVHDGCVRLSRGPRENRYRPAVDPLFRSAARWYGSRVIGVILTGSLDDGTAGMLAIKQHGGRTVVQDPEDAMFPSMPKSALASVAIDHVAPLPALGDLLTRLVDHPPAAAARAATSQELPVPDPELQLETEIAESVSARGDAPTYVGKPSGFACPECHGTLWELNDGELVRFRCRVGHAFAPQSLSVAMSDQIDEALWVVLRSLRESAALSVQLAAGAERCNMPELATNYRERAREARQRATLVEQILQRGQLFADFAEPTAGSPRPNPAR
jgi:two-component system, chemotaxis family, protein-glutamate methylesterase/glutaminase